MASQHPRVASTPRTETGKGASRRARREGLFPAVLYGHNTVPQHLLIEAKEFAAVLRHNGLNAVVSLEIDGDEQLALTRQVDMHPVRNYIEHVDLLVVRRGEKVIVEVPVIIEGEAAPKTLVIQDSTYIEIEADALNLPDELIVSVEDVPAVTNITADQVPLPEGASLVSDPELLVVSVNEAPTAADLAEDTGEEEGAEETAEEAAAEE